MTFDDTLARYGLSKQNLLVWAFIPFREDGFFDEGYDAALTERELGLAFSELGVDWRWQPVTLTTMQDAVQRVCAESGDRRPLVLNYCDGDEVNGYPGVSVVHFLTEAGIPYSGADARFYDISTSKVRMKHLFREAGVPSPDFRVINDPERDTVDLCERLGTPLIVKPSVSAGSRGLSSASVISSNEAAGKLYRRLKQGLHDLDFSCSEVYAERYVNGPEYTVLVVGSHLFPENKRVYPPMERVMNANLPETERFLSYERYWKNFSEETPLPPGEKLYVNRLAHPDTWPALQEHAWKAHCAVMGMGYSRVDIRVDAQSGQINILEVNANCSLSSPEDDTSVGYILKESGNTFSNLIGEILADALQRHFYFQQHSNPKLSGVLSV